MTYIHYYTSINFLFDNKKNRSYSLNFLIMRTNEKLIINFMWPYREAINVRRPPIQSLLYPMARTFEWSQWTEFLVILLISAALRCARAPPASITASVHLPGIIGKVVNKSIQEIKMTYKIWAISRVQYLLLLLMNLNDNYMIIRIL